MASTDMKLLMESWRKYSDTIENADQFGSVYLFENKTAVKKDFESLLQEFDSGKITENELYECWNKSMLYEQKLLNEVDWEKEGELVQQPGYKPPQDRPGMLDAAWKKAQDWVLEKCVQLFQMAKRGIELVAKAVRPLITMVSKFHDEHPLAVKVIGITVLSLVLVALMAGVSMAGIQAPTDAEAGGLTPGPGGEISDNAYEALRGMIHDTKNLGVELPQRAEAMKAVDAMQQSPDVHFLGDVNSWSQSLLEELNGMVKLCRDQDPEACNFVERVTKLSKEANYSVMGTPTR